MMGRLLCRVYKSLPLRRPRCGKGKGAWGKGTFVPQNIQENIWASLTLLFNFNFLMLGRV